MLKQSSDAVYSWKRPKDLARVLAPSHAPPIVILPGFGNCSSDYLAPFGLKEEGIAHFLQVTFPSQIVKWHLSCTAEHITECFAYPVCSKETLLCMWLTLRDETGYK